MSYFRSDNKYIYLEAEYVEFYIPSEYFDASSKFAQDLGTMISCLGLFNVGIFKSGKLTEMKTMALPTWIEIFKYDFETKNVQLPGNMGETSCMVLSYHKGDKIMPSSAIEDSENALVFLKFIAAGKIPKSVPYDKALQIWRDNQFMNGVHLGVPAVIEEMILAVSYRNANNPMEKFAHLVGKDPEKYKDDFIMVTIRQICQYASTFTALTFEDIDAMITTSINRTKQKKPEAFSPIEDILKM